MEETVSTTSDTVSDDDSSLQPAVSPQIDDGEEELEDQDDSVGPEAEEDEVEEEEEEDYEDEDEDVEYEDEDEDDSNLPIEVRFARVQEENRQLQNVMKQLGTQLTNYKEIVDRDKEREKQKIEALKAQIEEQKLLVKQLEQNQGPGDQLLQKKLQETEARLRLSEERFMKFQAQTAANLEGFKQEMEISESTNVRLSEALQEEREMHRQTVLQLVALKKESMLPVPQNRDQEIRLRVSFEGSSITGAVLIPENDEERAKLKQDNDFLREKYRGLSQKQVILQDELNESKSKLQATIEESKKASDALSELQERYSNVVKENDELKERSMSASTSMNLSPSSVMAEPKMPVSKSVVVDLSRDAMVNGFSEAMKIYETYLLSGTKKELPISHDTKLKIFRSVREQEITPQLFSVAKKELVEYMDSTFFEEWKKTQTDECKFKSFNEILFDAEGDDISAAKNNITKFFFEKDKSEYLAFLEDINSFASHKFTRSASMSDIKSDDKKHHKKKKHHKSSKGPKTLEPEEAHGRLTDAVKASNAGFRRSLPPVASAIITTSTAPPLPPLPTDPGAQQSGSSATLRRNSVPSRGADELVGLFAKSDGSSPTPGEQQETPSQTQTPPVSKTPPQQGQQQGPPHLVISRTTTAPVGTSLTSLLSGGAAGAGSAMISPRTAQMLGGVNSKKTIRKTSRQLRLTVEGGKEVPSLYGGPVSPEAITPRSLAHLASTAASSAATTSPKMPMSAKSVMIPGTLGSSHDRQPSFGSARSTTFMQNLEELCRTVSAREDTSLLATGAVKSITAVRVEFKGGKVKDEVWIAHNNPGAEGSKGNPTISVYDCKALALEGEIKLPDVTVNKMVFAGKNVWLATSAKEVICVNAAAKMQVTTLKGHEGSIIDVADMGKTVWTIGDDHKIGVWEVGTLKLRKMIKAPVNTSFMSCIIHVSGVAWIGSIGGIQRYNVDTLKPEKEPVQMGEAMKYMMMSVTKLLLVNNCVWALHHDENMVSVWSSDNKVYLGAFRAVDVVSMLHVGSHVWMTSHNTTIRCFDTSTLSKIGELNGMHQDWITCMSIGKHMGHLRVWSGSTDATIVLWDANIRAHEFAEDPSCLGCCEICKKPLKSREKTLRCKVCGNFAIHARCLDLLPTGCVCKGRKDSSHELSKL